MQRVMNVEQTGLLDPLILMSCRFGTALTKPGQMIRAPKLSVDIKEHKLRFMYFSWSSNPSRTSTFLQTPFIAVRSLPSSLPTQMILRTSGQQRRTRCACVGSLIVRTEGNRRPAKAVIRSLFLWTLAAWMVWMFGSAERHRLKSMRMETVAYCVILTLTTLFCFHG